MKKYSLIVFVLLCININAQSFLESTLKNVKVYRQNAEITRTTSAKVIAGNQDIVITDISTYINPNSLQVQLTNGKNITLLSAKYQRNYIDKKQESTEIETLKQTLNTKQYELSWIYDQKATYKGMEDILNANKDLSGKSGFTPQQVISLVNSYKTKLLEIKKEVTKLNKEEIKIKAELTKIQSQINELSGGSVPANGSIVLQLSSKIPTTTKIKLKYIVSNTGWSPLYDLRSNGIEENIHLNYKANVYQNTGVDWMNVPIEISNGNPVQNNNRPILNPLYANFFKPYAYGRANKQFDQEIEEVVAEETTTNMALKSTKKEEKFDDGFNYNAQLQQNQLNVEYKIPNKQTIKSDRKTQILPLDSYELDTKYVYHTVPKIDKGVYLLAKVSNWGKYNLTSGQANLFFQGAYIGKSYIDTNTTAKELLLSMGRDNNITVERESLKEYTASKFIGNNKKETFAYEISVKNKKNTVIDLEILDQIPVSGNKNIEVELLDKSNAEYNKQIGKLLWNLSLKAGETKSTKFSYTVKYPKKENVIGIK